MDLYQVQGTRYVLQRNEWDWKKEPLGLLCIWESVAQAKELGGGEELKYTVGVDTSDGMHDRTAIEVNRNGTASRPDELVAEWVGCVNPTLIPPIVYAIAKLFSTDDADALLAIEMASNGRMVQSVLLNEYHYPNFYIWKVRDKIGNQASRSLGWVTNPQTKPLLWTKGFQWMKDHKWKINSPWFIGEVKDFGYNPVRQEAEATHGAFDDRLMAGFIALMCSKDWLTDQDVTASVEVEEVRKAVAVPNPQTLAISAEEADNESGWVFY